MAEEHKGIAMVILGIVAVIAVVGLVLMFVRGQGATGEGIYGGAIKGVEAPYWTGRGVSVNYALPSGQHFPVVREQSRDWVQTDIIQRQGDRRLLVCDKKRDPNCDVPSSQTKCPGGILADNRDRLWFEQSRGYTCFDNWRDPEGQAGSCCYPPGALV